MESKGNFETNKQTHPKDMRAKKRENYVTQGFLIFWGVFFGLFEMKDAVIRIPRQYIPIEFLQVKLKEKLSGNRGGEKGI